MAWPSWRVKILCSVKSIDRRSNSMPERVKLMREYVSGAGLKEIDHWIKKYPEDQKQSAVMAALRVVQQEQGYLTTEAMDVVAAYLDMRPIAVYEVASFYSMYER